MADVLIVGTIEGIRYFDSHAVVNVSEYKQGYKKKDGEVVDDSIVTWKVYYKPYFKKYLASNFDNGMYVKIKGVIVPYVRDKSGVFSDGYTIFGETINREPYPKNLRRERRMIKESQEKSSGCPDIENFTKDDF